MQLTILGANSALPVHGRFPSAQLLQIEQNHILIDCGEGTQLRLRELKTKWSKIDFIFISHFHGDHFFGLPGFLTSLSLLGRKRKMTIIAPEGLPSILSNLFDACGVRLSFEMDIVEIRDPSSTKVFEHKDFEVTSIPLDHRIPTFGYLFREGEKEKNIIPHKIREYNLSIDQIKRIKKGDDLVLADGSNISNQSLTIKRTRPVSYAYCSDTRYDPSIASILDGVDLLYHESTYLHENLDLAEFSKHTTATEVGQLAKAANVKHLLIGHYSSRYKDLQPLKKEAKAQFDHVTLALHGLKLEIGD